MPEDEFWGLIDLLSGSTEPPAVERLAEALQAAGTRKAVAFQERLAAQLYVLDQEALFRQPVRWSDDPDDAEPIPLSDDTFLYLRAAVVTQGRLLVQQVLADEVAGEEIETTLSYETGSNVEHWAPVECDPSGQPPLVATTLSDLLMPIEAYVDFAMTIRVEPVEYAWPMWFPDATLDAASRSIDTIVQDSGGLPNHLDINQVQVRVGLGERWQPTPTVAEKVQDDTGLGQVTRVHVEMPQSDVRAWRRPQQEAALTAVVARCVLAVLPAGHPSRALLEEAVSPGAALLPEGP